MKEPRQVWKRSERSRERRELVILSRGGGKKDQRAARPGDLGARWEQGGWEAKGAGSQRSPVSCFAKRKSQNWSAAGRGVSIKSPLREG